MRWVCLDFTFVDLHRLHGELSFEIQNPKHSKILYTQYSANYDSGESTNQSLPNIMLDRIFPQSHWCFTRHLRNISRSIVRNFVLWKFSSGWKDIFCAACAVSLKLIHCWVKHGNLLVIALCVYCVAILSLFRITWMQWNSLWGLDLSRKTLFSSLCPTIWKKRIICGNILSAWVSPRMKDLHDRNLPIIKFSVNGQSF